MDGEPPFLLSSDPPLELTQGFEGLLGIELLELSDEAARCRVAVRDELSRPAGGLHGGVYPSIADSLASWGTARAVAADGKVAVALSNQTTFLRAGTNGSVRATAIAKHRGRTTWVWEVEFTDDAGELCAFTRITVAVRDA